MPMSEIELWKEKDIFKYKRNYLQDYLQAKEHKIYSLQKN